MANPPKKKPKQARSRETVETLVEATTRILERDGLEGLTTNRVAEVAGVSIGSLYQYFPNKEALVEEVRSRFAARFEAGILALVARLPTLPPRDAIRGWVDTLIALHAEQPGVHNAVGTGTPPDAQRALLQIVEGYLDAHADRIRRPDRARASRVLVETSEALVHETALRAPAMLDDPAWRDEICDLLERYLLR